MTSILRLLLKMRGTSLSVKMRYSNSTERKEARHSNSSYLVHDMGGKRYNNASLLVLGPNKCGLQNILSIHITT
jgi:hypothetical protein